MIVCPPAYLMPINIVSICRLRPTKSKRLFYACLHNRLTHAYLHTFLSFSDLLQQALPRQIPAILNPSVSIFHGNFYVVLEIDVPAKIRICETGTEYPNKLFSGQTWKFQNFPQCLSWLAFDGFEVYDYHLNKMMAVTGVGAFAYVFIIAW